MFKLCLIGIGTGNPDHVTTEGQNAMRAADLILIPRKGATKADLADLRLQICSEVLDDTRGVIEFDLPVRDATVAYREGVEDWHDQIAVAWQNALAPHLPVRTVALLVWGDPSLYDSTLRIAARLNPTPEIQVVPGITALQALTAAHAIPLNAIGAPVVITTGRNLRDAGWPPGADRVAVMLDAGGAFETIDLDGVWIWWGAFLGMKEQILRSGPLSEVAADIMATRAKARRDHGWIMDIYVMERR